jgi:type I restriction enzyme S subunit
LCNIEISIPDYSEQQGLYNKLINSQKSSNILDAELKNQLELLRKLRQQLLQDAVQGKLVEQNKKDEPASELLKKIKKQKETLIKQKKLKIGRATEQSVSLINDIDIPKAWQWCKSDEIFFVTKLAGFEYSEHISLKESGEIPVVRAQNVRPLIIDKTNLLYIDAKTSATLERCALIKKCLLVTFIGAGIGDVATFEETERWHLAPNVAKMEPFEGCEESTNVKYLNYYLMSKLGQKEIFKHVKATAQPSLSMGTIRDIDFAIPPLAEQHRIVQKLDELMKYCNELEASIKQSESQNEKLLQQVLREALRKEPVEA